MQDDPWETSEPLHKHYVIYSANNFEVSYAVGPRLPL